MNRIRIGESEKPLNEVNESWITHQVRQRREDGQSVCAQVFLQGDNVHLVLSTPQCANGSGGGRQANEREQELINKWNERHLNRHDWAVGNLIAFLKQARLI